MWGVRSRPRFALARGFDWAGSLAPVLRGGGDFGLRARPRQLGGLGSLLLGSYSRLGAQAWRRTGAQVGEVSQQLLDLGTKPLRGRGAGLLGLYHR